MHVSVRTLHGIRTLSWMASNQDQAPFHARDLSDQKYIDHDYLTQILNTLKEHGLIESKKGPRGGYKLARSPEAITLLDIVSALEGPTIISPCTEPEYSDCEIVDECSTQDTLSVVAEEFKKLLGEITIETIAEDTKNAELENDILATKN